MTTRDDTFRFQPIRSSGSGAGRTRVGRRWRRPAVPPRGFTPCSGARYTTPLLTDRVFETEIDALTHPFLADHRVFDGVVFPAAAYLEMVLAAVGHVYETERMRWKTL